MGRISYTVTTRTNSCPHCGHVISKKTEGALTPVFSLLWIFFIPALIPYLIIRAWALKRPNIPKVGPKTITCPRCSMPVKTDKLALEDLNAKELLAYRFRIWFYVSYILGGVFGYSLLWFLLDGLQIVSSIGLTVLLSFLGIVAIVVTYRVKLAKCNSLE